MRRVCVFSLTHQRRLRHNAPVVSERETLHCSGRSPSGREGLANQMPVFPCSWFSGGKRELTSTSLIRMLRLSPPPRDPSAGFRGKMRCKSIKRVFVPQSMSQWESLPSHSGAANFPYSPHGLTYGRHAETRH